MGPGLGNVFTGQDRKGKFNGNKETWAFTLIKNFRKVISI